MQGEDHIPWYLSPTFVPLTPLKSWIPWSTNIDVNYVTINKTYDNYTCVCNIIYILDYLFIALGNMSYKPLQNFIMIPKVGSKF